MSAEDNTGLKLHIRQLEEKIANQKFEIGNLLETVRVRKIQIAALHMAVVGGKADGNDKWQPGSDHRTALIQATESALGIKEKE